MSVYLFWRSLKQTDQLQLIGFMTNAVACLVEITPTIGYVVIQPVAMIGVIVPRVCYARVMLFRRYLNDVLDVFSVQGIGAYRYYSGRGGYAVARERAFDRK
ncbi:hypothetical protein B6E78_07855 [Edwardsiella ictaluri]|nr:hypothetical protein B6E78_07855 [Edwardsiella ictaluri]